jgi:hypothetical protein
MTFLTSSRAPLHGARLRALALESWREAEHLVAARWREWRAAGREDRPGAFAAYTCALDAEAAAADELAVLHLREAA